MWRSIANQYQEFFEGIINQPTANFTSPHLAILFSAMRSDRDIWSGSKILVRAYWEWVHPDGSTEFIYTPYTRIGFNDRYYLDFSAAQIPYQVELLLNADADSIFYSIWQKNTIWRSRSFTVVIERETEILPNSPKRESILIENIGPGSCFLSFGDNGFDFALEAGYTASLDQKGLASMRIHSKLQAVNTSTSLKITEVTTE